MYYSGEKIILNYFNFDKKRKSEPALKFFYLFLSVDDLEFIHLFISLTGIVFHIIDNTYFYFAFFKLGKFQFFNFLIILSKYLRKQFFFFSNIWFSWKFKWNIFVILPTTKEIWTTTAEIIVWRNFFSLINYYVADFSSKRILFV